MAKLLKTLAEEYGFDSDYQYFEYIIESCINGQRQQVRKLFNQMKKDDKLHFLNEHLEDNDTDNEVKRICIEELLI